MYAPESIWIQLCQALNRVTMMDCYKKTLYYWHLDEEVCSSILCGQYMAWIPCHCVSLQKYFTSHLATVSREMSDVSHVLSVGSWHKWSNFAKLSMLQSTFSWSHCGRSNLDILPCNHTANLFWWAASEKESRYLSLILDFKSGL